VWEIEEKNKSTNTPAPLNEQSFLKDKTDNAIKLYSFIVKLLDSQRVKYTKRIASKWITFYGKSRAFMVIQFEENQIKLRLRLGDTHDSNAVEKLDENFDKLTSFDKFFHQITVTNMDNKEEIIKAMIDSYKFNNQ